MNKDRFLFRVWDKSRKIMFALDSMQFDQNELVSFWIPSLHNDYGREFVKAYDTNFVLMHWTK